MCFAPGCCPSIMFVVCAHFTIITSILSTARSDNNESEYFSETLAAEALPHYQPAAKDTPSPTTSPYSSVDATNHANNNGYQQYQPSKQQTPSPPQQSTPINQQPKYQQPPMYNNNAHTNGNGVPQLGRTNVVMSASNPSGGVSASSQMQQALQQKYYDQYENYARPSPTPNGNGVNGNGVNNNHSQNGMTQSAYNGTKAYAGPPQQMTVSYNQQMAYNNHYNGHHQNGGNGVGKIADYDPMTDGPRNVPQTARPNQTLIYSSDRAAREYSDSVFTFFFVVSLFCPPFAHQITFVTLEIVQNLSSCLN